MASSYLVLDIETVPDPALHEASSSTGFPPLPVHRPVVLGVVWLDASYRLKKIGVLGEDRDERGMLTAFSSFVEKHQPDLVTFNGRGFDLPVLVLRALRHGVPMPWYYQGRLRHRYTEEGHVDLCDLLSDHGAARSVSLDAVARLVGLPGKVGVDGSQVEQLWKTGQLEAIKRYCLADVAQTALLFLRFRMLQGVLAPDECRDRTAELIAGLRKERRLAPLFAALDRGQVAMRAA
jgi:3'-5' exonuclease